MKTTADLPNYRSVECCATCDHCLLDDSAECHYWMDKQGRGYEDVIFVDHSGLCDFYKHDGIERK
jgi:hypothetical protein